MLETIFVFIVAAMLLFMPLVAAIVSSFKSKHIWSVSMYFYVVLLAFWMCIVSPFVNGLPLIFYHWWYLVAIFALTIGVPLIVQLKQLSKRTRLILMWGTVGLIPVVVYCAVCQGVLLHLS